VSRSIRIQVSWFYVLEVTTFIIFFFSLSKLIEIQSLPRLFSLATKFDDEIVRHSATAALSHIDNLNRTRNRLQINSVDNDSSSNPRSRNARQVENVKIKMGMQIDDKHFMNMLMESQVCRNL
jgi:rapamycin-insensitive companion of mTOR